MSGKHLVHPWLLMGADASAAVVPSADVVKIYKCSGAGTFAYCLVVIVHFHKKSVCLVMT